MSGYHEYIDDPMMREAMIRHGKAKLKRWKTCRCGNEATQMTCVGAKLINLCETCYAEFDGTVEKK